MTSRLRATAFDVEATQRFRVALVTGASAGIGECFARRLAGAGCDLVLVARRHDRLELLADELRQCHGVSVEVIAADLADPAQLAVVEGRLRDPEGSPVDLLINNAAAGALPPRAFHDQQIHGETAKITLNVTVPMRLTHAALPGMCARGRGGVLFVSSVAAYWPQPHGTTYAATKAFLSSFGETLHCEHARSGVHITTLVPGFTRRGEHREGGPRSFRLPDFAWLDRDDVARAGIEAVSVGAPICVPGVTYRIALRATRVLPRSVTRSAFRRIWGG